MIPALPTTVTYQNQAATSVFQLLQQPVTSCFSISARDAQNTKEHEDSKVKLNAFIKNSFNFCFTIQKTEVTLTETEPPNSITLYKGRKDRV